jgi:hypothetical protein
VKMRCSFIGKVPDFINSNGNVDILYYIAIQLINYRNFCFYCCTFMKKLYVCDVVSECIHTGQTEEFA